MRKFLIVFLGMMILGELGNLTQCRAEQKLKIITTLFPTYDFVRVIGKEAVDVSLLLPPGIEPHLFEPRPQDIVAINNADVFIYTGKYMEPWVEDLLKGITNKKLLVVDASTGINLLTGKSQNQSSVDPHIWLDFSYAQRMVANISVALIAKDAARTEVFKENMTQYINQLIQLDQQYQQSLANCRLRTFIYGGHFAFGYLVQRYQLKFQSPYSGFSPDAQPSAKAIGELIDKVRLLGAKVIYYEELIDPKVARIISGETGAQLMLLNGAHNISKDDFKKGVTFIQIMTENLAKLKIGLECQ